MGSRRNTFDLSDVEREAKMFVNQLRKWAKDLVNKERNYHASFYVATFANALDGMTTWSTQQLHDLDLEPLEREAKQIVDGLHKWASDLKGKAKDSSYVTNFANALSGVINMVMQQLHALQLEPTSDINTNRSTLLDAN